jgi:ADP-heptose:LPS heptosyltransferase
VARLVASGRNVVVTGSPDEVALTREVAGPKRPEVIDLGGRTDLQTCAEVLASAECLVVGNTGPAHLAAAVGTPVVSLFAPTVPAARWRPWGVTLELLGDQQASCAESRARVCPVAGHPCLAGVSAEEALQAVNRVARTRARVAS